MPAFVDPEPPKAIPGDRRSRLLGPFLNAIEKLGNRLPDPLFLYLGLAFAVPLLSWPLAALGWSKTLPGRDEAITVVNLLTADQIQRMFTTAVDNFVRFPPLGTVLVAMLGIGVAERSGFIRTFLQVLVSAGPPKLISAVVVFAGVMSSMAADVGYVVLTPLGAVIFLGLGRHPLAGLCAAFAGVAGGFSANLFLTSLDPLLVGFTQAATDLIDPNHVVRADANYYFMIGSTVLVTVLGWWVTERIVEPRLGQWDPSRGDAETAELAPVAPSPAERRALRAALGSLVLMAVLFLGLTLPESALFRDEAGTLAPFVGALVPVIALGFLVPGLVFGLVAGSIRDSRTVAGMTADTMATMGAYIVLAFAAAQFVAYFQWSNLGILLAISGAEGLERMGLGTLPLLAAFIVLAAGINLVLGSASAKWGIMAQVFVPMFMLLGISPELTQAAYRVGDSCTNMITPLNPYFPIILAFAMKYQRDLGIGTLVSAMVPYALAFGVAWILFLGVWVLLGWPLGPGAPLVYPS
ncbi:MAG: AbgT family transporter [Puniceicoccaceae bacterium]|nr:MAG: AbgT family transporter [Puniceicoccaceae bacterium]